MAFNSWPGLLGHWIFKFTWVWNTVASISAASDLFSALTSSPTLFIFSSSGPILNWERDINSPLDGIVTVAEEEDEDEVTELSTPLLPPSAFLILLWASRD